MIRKTDVCARGRSDVTSRTLSSLGLCLPMWSPQAVRAISLLVLKNGHFPELIVVPSFDGPGTNWGSLCVKVRVDD